MPRVASRLPPGFEGTERVYTMTYLQQPVLLGALVLLTFCRSQALSWEHQAGGWKNWVPFASITTGKAGRGARR